MANTLKASGDAAIQSYQKRIALTAYLNSPHHNTMVRYYISAIQKRLKDGDISFNMNDPIFMRVTGIDQALGQFQLVCNNPYIVVQFRIDTTDNLKLRVSRVVNPDEWGVDPKYVDMVSYDIIMDDNGQPLAMYQNQEQTLDEVMEVIWVRFTESIKNSQ